MGEALRRGRKGQGWKIVYIRIEGMHRKDADGINLFPEDDRGTDGYDTSG